MIYSMNIFKMIVTITVALGCCSTAHLNYLFIKEQ